MKDDRVYLRHILECIRRVEEDTAGGKFGMCLSTTTWASTWSEFGRSRNTMCRP